MNKIKLVSLRPSYKFHFMNTRYSLIIEYNTSSAGQYSDLSVSGRTQSFGFLNYIYLHRICINHKYNYKNY